MRHPDEVVDDDAFLLTALGRLWAVGGDARRRAAVRRRRRGVGSACRPTPSSASATSSSPARRATPADDRRRRLPRPRARRGPLVLGAGLAQPGRRRSRRRTPISWLVFLDDAGVGDERRRAPARARRRGRRRARRRLLPAPSPTTSTCIAPEHGRPSYEQLVRDLVRTGRVPDRIAHLALLAADDRQFRPGSSFFHRNQELGLPQPGVPRPGVGGRRSARGPLHIAVATMGAQRVVAGDLVPWPEQATVLGPVRVIPREFADVTVTAFDIDQTELFAESRLRAGLDERRRHRRAPSAPAARRRTAARPTTATTSRPRRDVAPRRHRRRAAARRPANDVVALRGDRRFVQDVRARSRSPTTGATRRSREGGVVLDHRRPRRHRPHDRRAAVRRPRAPARAARRGRRCPTRDDVGRPRSPASAPTTRRAGASAGAGARGAGAEVLLLARRRHRRRAACGDVVGRGARALRRRPRRRPRRRRRRRRPARRPRPSPTSRTCSPRRCTAPWCSSEVAAGRRPRPVRRVLVDQHGHRADRPGRLRRRQRLPQRLRRGPPGRRAHDHVHRPQLGRLERRRHGRAAAAARCDAGDERRGRSRATHPFFDARTTDHKGVTRLTARWSTERDVVPRRPPHRGRRRAAPRLRLPRARPRRPRRDRRRPPVRDPRPHVPAPARRRRRRRASRCRCVLDARPRRATASRSRERVAVGDADRRGRPDRPAAPGWRRDRARPTLLLQPAARRRAVDLAASRPRCPAPRAGAHAAAGPPPVRAALGRRRAGRSAATARPSPNSGSPTRSSATSTTVRPAPRAWSTSAPASPWSLIEGYTGDAAVGAGRATTRSASTGRLPRTVRRRGHRARRAAREASGFATFDVTLADADGNVLVAVEGFTIKRLDGALDLGLGRAAVAADVELDRAVAADRQLVAVRARLPAQPQRRASAPTKGRRAFARALAAAGGPSSTSARMDLDGLGAQTDASGQRPAPARRPATSSAVVRPARRSTPSYVEPRNDVEETPRRRMWQELLGVGQIGVLDNFFDLGGHSLIAVRLFAKVKKPFSVEFPISVLFEAPTIEACAALDPAGDARRAAATAPTPSAPRWRQPAALQAPRRHAPRRGRARDGRSSSSPACSATSSTCATSPTRSAPTDRSTASRRKGLFGGEEPARRLRARWPRPTSTRSGSCSPTGPTCSAASPAAASPPSRWPSSCRPHGEEVELLVMLDTAAAATEPLHSRDRAQDPARQPRREGPRLRSRSGPSTGCGGSGSSAPARADGPGAGRSRARCTRRRSRPRSTGRSRRYETQPYAGDITLYRPQLSAAPRLRPGPADQRRPPVHLRRQRLGPASAEQVDVIEVPGDHDSMVLEPNVRVVAGHLPGRDPRCRDPGRARRRPAARGRRRQWPLSPRRSPNSSPPRSVALAPPSGANRGAPHRRGRRRRFASGGAGRGGVGSTGAPPRVRHRPGAAARDLLEAPDAIASAAVAAAGLARRRARVARPRPRGGGRRREPGPVDPGARHRRRAPGIPRAATRRPWSSAAMRSTSIPASPSR